MIEHINVVVSGCYIAAITIANMHWSLVTLRLM